MARKHVHALPYRNVVPMESHSDGQNAGYFPRTLPIMLLALGSSKPYLFNRTLRLLHRNSYLLHVRVMIYERHTTDRICRIRQVIEASTPRWTFEGCMREAAREALAVLWHELDEKMAHSQYRHFPSWAKGAEVVVLPTRDHDCTECFTSQVKFIRALVRDLHEAVKEVKLLGEHEEESSQMIMEVEALCKKLREDAL
jgi:hypothetical protein